MKKIENLENGVTEQIDKWIKLKEELDTINRDLDTTYKDDTYSITLQAKRTKIENQMKELKFWEGDKVPTTDELINNYRNESKIKNVWDEGITAQKLDELREQKPKIKNKFKIKEGKVWIIDQIQQIKDSNKQLKDMDIKIENNSKSLFDLRLNKEIEEKKRESLLKRLRKNRTAIETRQLNDPTSPFKDSWWTTAIELRNTIAEGKWDPIQEKMIWTVDDTQFNEILNNIRGNGGIRNLQKYYDDDGNLNLESKNMQKDFLEYVNARLDTEQLMDFNKINELPPDQLMRYKKEVGYPATLPPIGGGKDNIYSQIIDYKLKKTKSAEGDKVEMDVQKKADEEAGAAEKKRLEDEAKAKKKADDKAAAAAAEAKKKADDEAAAAAAAEAKKKADDEAAAAAAAKKKADDEAAAAAAAAAEQQKRIEDAAAKKKADDEAKAKAIAEERIKEREEIYKKLVEDVRDYYQTQEKRGDTMFGNTVVDTTNKKKENTVVDTRTKKKTEAKEKVIKNIKAENRKREKLREELKKKRDELKASIQKNAQARMAEIRREARMKAKGGNKSKNAAQKKMSDMNKIFNKKEGYPKWSVEIIEILEKGYPYSFNKKTGEWEYNYSYNYTVEFESNNMRQTQKFNEKEFADAQQQNLYEAKDALEEKVNADDGNILTGNYDKKLVKDVTERLASKRKQIDYKENVNTKDYIKKKVDKETQKYAEDKKKKDLNAFIGGSKKNQDNLNIFERIDEVNKVIPEETSRFNNVQTKIDGIGLVKTINREKIPKKIPKTQFVVNSNKEILFKVPILDDTKKTIKGYMIWKQSNSNKKQSENLLKALQTNISWALGKGKGNKNNFGFRETALKNFFDDFNKKNNNRKLKKKIPTYYTVLKGEPPKIKKKTNDNIETELKPENFINDIENSTENAKIGDYVEYQRDYDENLRKAKENVEEEYKNKYQYWVQEKNDKDIINALNNNDTAELDNLIKLKEQEEIIEKLKSASENEKKMRKLIERFISGESLSDTEFTELKELKSELFNKFTEIYSNNDIVPSANTKLTELEKEVNITKDKLFLEKEKWEKRIKNHFKKQKEKLKGRINKRKKELEDRNGKSLLDLEIDETNKKINNIQQDINKAQQDINEILEKKLESKGSRPSLIESLEKKDKDDIKKHLKDIENMNKEIENINKELIKKKSVKIKRIENEEVAKNQRRTWLLSTDSQDTSNRLSTDSQDTSNRIVLTGQQQLDKKISEEMLLTEYETKERNEKFQKALRQFVEAETENNRAIAMKKLQDLGMTQEEIIIQNDFIIEFGKDKDGKVTSTLVRADNTKEFFIQDPTNPKQDFDIMTLNTMSEKEILDKINALEKLLEENKTTIKKYEQRLDILGETGDLAQAQKYKEAISGNKKQQLPNKMKKRYERYQMTYIDTYMEKTRLEMEKNLISEDETTKNNIIKLKKEQNALEKTQKERFKKRKSDYKEKRQKMNQEAIKTEQNTAARIAYIQRIREDTPGVSIPKMSVSNNNEANKIFINIHTSRIGDNYADTPENPKNPSPWIKKFQVNSDGVDLEKIRLDKKKDVENAKLRIEEIDTKIQIVDSAITAIKNKKPLTKKELKEVEDAKNKLLKSKKEANEIFKEKEERWFIWVSNYNKALKGDGPSQIWIDNIDAQEKKVREKYERQIELENKIDNLNNNIKRINKPTIDVVETKKLDELNEQKTQLENDLEAEKRKNQNWENQEQEGGKAIIAELDKLYEGSNGTNIIKNMEKDFKKWCEKNNKEPQTLFIKDTDGSEMVNNLIIEWNPTKKQKKNSTKKWIKQTQTINEIIKDNDYEYQSILSEMQDAEIKQITSDEYKVETFNKDMRFALETIEEELSETKKQLLIDTANFASTNTIEIKGEKINILEKKIEILSINKKALTDVIENITNADQGIEFKNFDETILGLKGEEVSLEGENKVVSVEDLTILRDLILIRKQKLKPEVNMAVNNLTENIQKYNNSITYLNEQLRAESRSTVHIGEIKNRDFDGEGKLAIKSAKNQHKIFIDSDICQELIMDRYFDAISDNNAQKKQKEMRQALYKTPDGSDYGVEEQKKYKKAAQDKLGGTSNTDTLNQEAERLFLENLFNSNINIDIENPYYWKINDKGEWELREFRVKLKHKIHGLKRQAELLKEPMSVDELMKRTTMDFDPTQKTHKRMGTSYGTSIVGFAPRDFDLNEKPKLVFSPGNTRKFYDQLKYSEERKKLKKSDGLTRRPGKGLGDKMFDQFRSAQPINDNFDTISSIREENEIYKNKVKEVDDYKGPLYNQSDGGYIHQQVRSKKDEDVNFKNIDGKAEDGGSLDLFYASEDQAYSNYGNISYNENNILGNSILNPDDKKKIKGKRKELEENNLPPMTIEEILSEKYKDWRAERKKRIEKIKQAKKKKYANSSSESNQKQLQKVNEEKKRATEQLETFKENLKEDSKEMTSQDKETRKRLTRKRLEQYNEFLTKSTNEEILLMLELEDSPIDPVKQLEAQQYQYKKSNGTLYLVQKENVETPIDPPDGKNPRDFQLIKAREAFDKRYNLEVEQKNLKLEQKYLSNISDPPDDVKKELDRINKKIEKNEKELGVREKNIIDSTVEWEAMKDNKGVTMWVNNKTQEKTYEKPPQYSFVQVRDFYGDSGWSANNEGQRVLRLIEKEEDINDYIKFQKEKNASFEKGMENIRNKTRQSIIESELVNSGLVKTWDNTTTIYIERSKPNQDGESTITGQWTIIEDDEGKKRVTTDVGGVNKEVKELESNDDLEETVHLKGSAKIENGKFTLIADESEKKKWRYTVKNNDGTYKIYETNEMTYADFVKKRGWGYDIENQNLVEETEGKLSIDDGQAIIEDKGMETSSDLNIREIIEAEKARNTELQAARIITEKEKEIREKKLNEIENQYNDDRKKADEAAKKK